MLIAGREVGMGSFPLVVAEIGVNHDGDPARAVELVESAAAAGADAVKLQYFSTDLLMSRAAKLASYQKDAGETDPISMLRRLELDLDAMGTVVERAKSLGLASIVTVFSEDLVDEAKTLGWDAYKTASPDITHRPLLDKLNATGRPLIVSTGASTLEEVRRACGWLSGAQDRIVLLQCVSSYPVEFGSASLGGILALQGATGLPVGYSDHTREISTGAVCVGLGACVLEKHFTYDTSAAGPDHRASLDAAGMKQYVEFVRRAFEAPWDVPSMVGSEGDLDAALGQPVKRVLDIERDVRRVSRQSLMLTRGLPSGSIVEPDDLCVKRPGAGLPGFFRSEVVGRSLARDIAADTPLMPADLSPPIAYVDPMESEVFGS